MRESAPTAFQTFQISEVGIPKGEVGRSSFTAELADPERRVHAQITSIEWTTHSNPQQAGELSSPGWVQRFFPDAAAPGGAARTKVDVRVQLEPHLADIAIVMDWFDADDPDHDGPIDTSDPDIPGANPDDNFDTTGYSPPSLSDPPPSDANGVIRTTFDIGSIQPGNNFRIAAAARQEELDRVYALAPDDNGRLFFDATPDSMFDPYGSPPDVPPDVLLTESSSTRGIKVTPHLRVWRTVHVEVDSMGSEDPPNYQFPADDLLRGDVPDPDTSGLEAALQQAYVQVVVGTQYDNSQTPWRHDFANLQEINDYMVGANGQRGTRNQESAPYWVVYVIGIYEDYDQDLDNDDPVSGDLEVASTGLTRGSEPEWSAINMEVVRDRAAQWQWTAAEQLQARKGVVIHEIGHQFELVDDYQFPPTHVMWSYENDPNEDLIRQRPNTFLESDILRIRRDTVTP